MPAASVSVPWQWPGGDFPVPMDPHLQPMGRSWETAEAEAGLPAADQPEWAQDSAGSWALAFPWLWGVPPRVTGELFQNKQGSLSPVCPSVTPQMKAWPQRVQGLSQQDLHSHLGLPAGWTQVWLLCPIHTGHAQVQSPMLPLESPPSPLPPCPQEDCSRKVLPGLKFWLGSRELAWSGLGGGDGEGEEVSGKRLQVWREMEEWGFMVAKVVSGVDRQDRERWSTKGL